MPCGILQQEKQTSKLPKNAKIDGNLGSQLLLNPFGFVDQSDGKTSTLSKRNQCRNEETVWVERTIGQMTLKRIRHNRSASKLPMKEHLQDQQKSRQNHIGEI